MYTYEYDPETGGIVLNNMPLKMSKEPRPVYYRELEILGFDQYWAFPRDDSAPFMWAEANKYWYRGRLVAQTSGGSLYTKPELHIIEAPEPDGHPLRFIDVDSMVEKNRDIMGRVVDDTIKRIYNTYVDYQKKIDVFYVAFSGGKDSVVVLDLVSRALPHNAFKVLFGDTGMEFRDTYEFVDQYEEWCKEHSIEFLRARSPFKPNDMWQKFGPPATVERWCCSTHKTAPQILALRQIINKPSFRGMAFVGIRAGESLSRANYEYISHSEKHKGQDSCNPYYRLGFC